MVGSLKTFEPVAEQDPSCQLKFPLNARRDVGLRQAFFLDEESSSLPISVFTKISSEIYELGRYLRHCVRCAAEYLYPPDAGHLLTNKWISSLNAVRRDTAITPSRYRLGAGYLQ